MGRPQKPPQRFFVYFRGVYTVFLSVEVAANEFIYGKEITPHFPKLLWHISQLLITLPPSPENLEVLRYTYF